MNILVYGAGAVGGYLGGKLALGGQQVMLSPADTAAAINADGLLITEGDRTQRAPVRATSQLPDAFAPTTGYDLVILGMKSYDLAVAVEQLAAVCPRPAQVMGTQNGIGVEEIIAGRLGSERTLLGAVTIPISRMGDNHLMIEKEGRGLGIAPVEAGRSIEEWVALFHGPVSMPIHCPTIGR